MKLNAGNIDPDRLRQYAVDLFAKKNSLIDRLYVSDVQRKPLIYYIVLKEDTFDNRDSVYDVLLELQDASSLDDVHFSFYPPTLKESLINETPVSLSSDSSAASDRSIG